MKSLVQLRITHRNVVFKKLLFVSSRLYPFLPDTQEWLEEQSVGAFRQPQYTHAVFHNTVYIVWRLLAFNVRTKEYRLSVLLSMEIAVGYSGVCSVSSVGKWLQAGKSIVSHKIP